MLENRALGAPTSGSVIPLSVPEIRGNEWEYVKECLDTNFVSSVGPFVDRFERSVADYVGTRYAVATVNGTAALHIALLVAGVRLDDEVLVSSLTFISPANAIRYVGAWPVFIDAEQDYWQMNPNLVMEFLEKRCERKMGEVWDKETKRRVSAIVPVHILGHPVDMDPIILIAKKYNIKVIEDATESLGAEYKGKKTGNLGDIACFSFNGNKIITTGGGGMITTDNEAWAKKAKYLTTQAKDDPIEFVHNEIGFNYRLTNVQAAIGIAQMEKLNEYIAIKLKIAEKYSVAFQSVTGITLMSQAPWAKSIFWMYTLLIDEVAFGMSSRALLRKLEQRGIQSRPLWQPIHRSKAHGTSLGQGCEIADRLNRQALSVPCSVGLTDSDQSKVIHAVLEMKLFTE